ncbi:hypothetical protein EDD18DRAFT_1365241 [Armillaria luteobubalina]|uniref:Uncharacterized protein n=1 Tax=Armillaria luteobubalina TaxID=153913 RepID=A0AA39P525_9AGAR|nr:hypothetical protein EDD18DRAFT_1365241 [Armillaria luteobubalina]
MALPSWCTPKQNAWFVSQLAKFHQAHLSNTVGTFLAASIKEFMRLWPLPECAETFAGNSPEDVAKWAKQNVHYQKRKEQIENRFKNKCGKASVVAASATTASGKQLATSNKKKIIFNLRLQRHLGVVQIYSQCYYPDRIKPNVKKAFMLAPTTLSHGQKLTIINKITHSKFQSETKEIKAEVLDALEQLHEVQAKASLRGEWTPEDYLDAIDAAPALLNRFLSDLTQQTGWWFTIIAGGPDPADRGNI